MSQKYYIGRDWFFWWSHLDADDDPVENFATNTYYVAVQLATAKSSADPVARIECTKTLATGELYAELGNATTDALQAGAYTVYYEIIDASGRLVGLADRDITVDEAPNWEA